MSEKDPEAKELVLEPKQETMIRHSGNVHVVTVPSAMMANPTVKNNIGVKGKIQLVREGGNLYLQIPLKVSLEGRFLNIKRK